MNFAENIRLLRLKENLTQEELARHIGCSPQAVSRWERDEGFPEITLLPSIAGYFKVTLDELFGMDEHTKRERIKQIYLKKDENAAQDRRDENIALLRDAIREFPHEYQFHVTLAVDLEFNYGADGRREAIEIYEWLMERGYTQAENNLMHSYAKNGQLDKAREIAARSEIAYGSQDYLYPQFCTGEDRILFSQHGINTFAPAVFDMINFMVDAEEEFGVEMPYAERIAMLEKGLELFDVILEGQEGFLGLYYISAHRDIARFAAADGDTERAVAAAERAVDYAITYDRRGYYTLEELPGSDKPKTRPLLLSRVGTDARAVNMYPSPNRSAQLLEVLSGSRFDVVRDDARFEAALERLRGAAQVVVGKLK